MSKAVNSQPHPIHAPLVAPYAASIEKACACSHEIQHQHEFGVRQQGRCSHNNRARARRIITTILLFLLSIAALLAVSCLWDAAFNEGSWFASDGSSTWASVSAFVKRQSDGSGNNGNQTTFVKNKLYLIVLFVGLFLCLIAAIMLAAWCCRGTFNNPCCCPCYACAACGGLACIECISCGLCAGIAENV